MTGDKAVSDCAAIIQFSRRFEQKLWSVVLAEGIGLDLYCELRTAKQSPRLLAFSGCHSDFICVRYCAIHDMMILGADFNFLLASIFIPCTSVRMVYDIYVRCLALLTSRRSRFRGIDVARSASPDE